MYKSSTPQQPLQHQLPPLALWLLTRMTNRRYREELIGDLQEEYGHRCQSPQGNASAWLWRQTLHAVWHGQKAALTSPTFLQGLAVTLCGLGMFALFGLVLWLSNMDETSDALWQQVLAGNMVKILTMADFWHEALPQFQAQHVQAGMFINYPSMIGLGLWCLVMWTLLKVHQLPARHVVSAGLTLMSLPYLLGTLYIHFNVLPPQQLGPILAVMILTPLYIMPCLTVVFIKRLRTEQQLAR